MSQVIDSPDVLSAIGDIPYLAPTLNAFYEGRYRNLFTSLTALYPSLLRDRYLSRHAAHVLRELRIAAYNQFLESYKSVTLGGMAAGFGVTPALLDRELSRFIAAGCINAKIDAVAGELRWWTDVLQWKGCSLSGGCFIFFVTAGPTYGLIAT